MIVIRINNNNNNNSEINNADITYGFRSLVFGPQFEGAFKKALGRSQSRSVHPQPELQLAEVNFRRIFFRV